MKQKEEKKIKSFANFNKRYNYVFLDESGNPSNSLWNKIEENIKENGYLVREFSTFTISGIFIKSKRQYNFLTRDLRSLKRNILHINPHTFIHRTDLKSTKFLTKHSITDKSKTWKFESELLDLISKHKLPIFSASFNRELIFQKPTFNFDFYKYKFNIEKVCVEKIIQNISAYLKEKYKNSGKIKKTILVFEISDSKKEKLICNIYSNLLKKYPNYNLYFKNLIFCTKLDKNGHPITGNELIDFVNYAPWQWASIFYYQKTKIQFPNYPAHLKKSIARIDVDLYNQQNKSR